MSRVVSFIVLVAILAILTAMFFKVMAQFVLPLFLAAVLVVVFKPLHVWVRDRLPGRIRLSALVTTTLIMLVVLLPTTWLGWNAYLEGRDVVVYLQDRNNQKDVVRKIETAAKPFVDFYDRILPKPPELQDDVAAAAPPPDAAATDKPSTDADVAKTQTPKPRPAKTFNMQELFDIGFGFVGGVLFDTFQGVLRTLLGLLIMVLAIYYFLVDGPTMIHTMMRLSPLDNEYERELLDKFANVSRAVVVAVLAAAVVQGMLAGIGFYFALDPGAPISLLMMVTMILAVVPFVGAAGVWIPTCIWIYLYQGQRMVDGELVTGEPLTAILLALYCGGVVSTIDNVIKPLVLHGQSNLHPLLALMSVLGGVKALGPVGILIGPMLVAFVHALLVMVNKELRLMSSAAGEDPQQKTIFPLLEVLEENSGLADEAASPPSSSSQAAASAEPASASPPTSSDAEKRPSPLARVRDAAKRRKRRK